MGNRRRLEAEIRSGTEPGLLAYVDDVLVGWCRVGLRESFDRLEHSSKLVRIDDQDVWSVVCFYVHPSAKRGGVAAALSKLRSSVPPPTVPRFSRAMRFGTGT
ncbi:MAG: hypothetical protein ACR2GV_01745 [Gaiellaceae bacterium]